MNKINTRSKESNSQLMNPQVDFVFKNIFGNEHHPLVLISLLNGIFGYTNDSPKRIVKVVINNPITMKEYKEDKYSVFDIKATVNDGDQINIEMQIKNQFDMKARSLFYLSKLVVGQLEESQRYIKLKPSVVISIMNFNLFDDDSRVHRAFSMRDNETFTPLTSIAEIHFIELPKLPKLAKANESNINLNFDDLLTDWLLFLTNPESEVMTMIQNKVPEINEALNILDVLSKDKAAREIYENRKKAMMDEISNLEGSREEGLEEGLEKGLEKGKRIEKLEIARKLKNKGYSAEDITNITELSIEEIKSL